MVRSGATNSDGAEVVHFGATSIGCALWSNLLGWSGSGALWSDQLGWSISCALWSDLLGWSDLIERIKHR
jgi:hypothetical protein